MKLTGFAHVISSLLSEVPLECTCDTNLSGFQNEKDSINPALQNCLCVGAHFNRTQAACNTLNGGNNFCKKEKALFSSSIIIGNKYAERKPQLTISLLQHKSMDIMYQLRCTNSSKNF